MMTMIDSMANKLKNPLQFAICLVVLCVALPKDASANPRKFCATVKKSLKEHPNRFATKESKCARVWSSGLRSEQYPKYSAKCPEVMKKHFPSNLVLQCEGMDRPTTPVCTKLYSSYAEQAQVSGSFYDAITPNMHVGNGTGTYPKGTLISDEDLRCIQLQIVARAQDQNFSDSGNKITAFVASLAGWHQKWQTEVQPFIAISERACEALKTTGIHCTSPRSGKYPERPKDAKAYLSKTKAMTPVAALAHLEPGRKACAIAQDLAQKEESWTTKPTWKAFCMRIANKHAEKTEEERVRKEEEERLRIEEEERLKREEEERIRKEEEERIRKEEEAERAKKEAAEKKRTAAAKSALCKGDKNCIESLSFGPGHENPKLTDKALYDTVRCLLGVGGGPWCKKSLLPTVSLKPDSLPTSIRLPNAGSDDASSADAEGADAEGAEAQPAPPPHIRGAGISDAQRISEIEALLPILKIRHYQKLLKISDKERDSCLVGGGRFVNKDRGACRGLHSHLDQLGPTLQLRECLANNGTNCSHKQFFPRTEPKSALLKKAIQACSAAPSELQPCDSLLKYVDTLSKSSSCTSTIPEFRTNNGSSSFRYARVPSLPLSSNPIRTSSAGAKRSRYLVNLDIGLRWTYDPQMPYQVSSLIKTLDKLCREHPSEALARDACSTHQRLTNPKKDNNHIGQNCKAKARNYINQDSKYVNDRRQSCRDRAKEKLARWQQRCAQHRNDSYYSKRQTCTQRFGAQPTSSHCNQRKDAVERRSRKMNDAASCLDRHITTIDRLGNICLSLQKRRTKGSVAACYEMAYKTKCANTVVWE